MTFNSASFVVQVGALLIVLAALHKPLGIYLAYAFEGQTSSRSERLFYRLAGIDSGTEQTWPVYLRSVLAFSAVSILAVFGLQRLQGVLPGSRSLPGVDPWIGMNTAISFVTNTNWQTYVPETTVGIFVQMTLLTVQNFLSAAVGIVVVVALIRGIARTRTQRLGNFWVDLARTTFRVLLPMAFVAAVVMVLGGVVQNFWPTDVTNQATGASQTLPGGGRGKAQADSLRASRKGVAARLRQPDGTTRAVPGTELRRGDVVICAAGDVIPSDGEIIEGLASVDESTITGESAPVIRESGGDRSSVTGGTKVLSDRIVIRITTEPGQRFIDRMIRLVEGAVRQKTPNEIALHVLLVSLTIVFLAVAMSLAPFAALAGATPSPIVLVALLVCLIPTTIEALVPAIGIAGMDRLVQHNVLATSGRAVETAGDITTLLLDKTGTITYGNRRAVNFFPANNVERTRLMEAARVCSLGDETPEGRSIVDLAADKGVTGPDLATLERGSGDVAVIPSVPARA